MIRLALANPLKRRRATIVLADVAVDGVSQITHAAEVSAPDEPGGKILPLRTTYVYAWLSK
jgi:hypothetical protein